METEKSFSGEEAEKDFCGRLFFLAAIFPFSNEKACLGVTAKTDFFYRLKSPTLVGDFIGSNAQSLAERGVSAIRVWTPAVHEFVILHNKGACRILSP